jgi:hypothetical protein
MEVWFNSPCLDCKLLGSAEFEIRCQAIGNVIDDLSDLVKKFNANALQSLSDNLPKEEARKTRIDC